MAWRVLGPVTQILALTALALCWRRYPRNTIMMDPQSTIDPARAAWFERLPALHLRRLGVGTLHLHHG
jgi:hypothetical protein